MQIEILRGQLTALDGPLTETKEVVGGFANLECGWKEKAMEGVRQYKGLHRKHRPGWEREMAVRQILTPEKYALEAAEAERKQRS